MTSICLLSDAHLLFQAEWINDEKVLREEAKEVIDNFERVIKKVSEDSPQVIIFCGDIFDTKTESGQRVAHREAEKYMPRIKEILQNLIEKTGCKIYVVRGNHDSEPVLKSMEYALKGRFVYPKEKIVKVDGPSIAFMDSHYVSGPYDIPLEDVPYNADILVMHESVPIWNIPAPPRNTFASICKKFGIVFNGHLHSHQENVLDIPNFHLLPALIPSRRIKGNWMVKYHYEDGETSVENQDSPFGYLIYDGKKPKFKKYQPLQVIVRIELLGKTLDDYLRGIEKVYDALLEREDKENLRVWVKANTDKITIDRVIRPKVLKYSEIKTMDMESEGVTITEASPPLLEKEFQEVAFNREEVIEKVLSNLKGKELRTARKIFDEILTPALLLARKPEEPSAFKKLLDLASSGKPVSDAFVQRSWELGKL